MPSSASLNSKVVLLTTTKTSISVDSSVWGGLGILGNRMRFSYFIGSNFSHSHTHTIIIIALQQTHTRIEFAKHVVSGRRRITFLHPNFHHITHNAPTRIWCPRMRTVWGRFFTYLGLGSQGVIGRKQRLQNLVELTLISRHDVVDLKERESTQHTTRSRRIKYYTLSRTHTHTNLSY